MTEPNRPAVTVVEVGPRDGLQNERVPVPTATKIRFVDALADAGLRWVEATSFVNPKAVPQMADAADVMRGIRRPTGVRFPVLVPNERGYDRAREAGVDAVALFAAATEAFAKANLGTSVDGAMERFAAVAARARADGAWLRGYVSVAFHCPYSGAVSPEAVRPIVDRLLEMGCAEISLADTTGRATPDSVAHLLAALSGQVPVDAVALHLHDTSGTALDNVDVGLAAGVRVFDSAAGGLGGCPFAPGAPGNLATESLVAHLQSKGYHTGIDPEELRAATAIVMPLVRPEPGR